MEYYSGTAVSPVILLMQTTYTAGTAAPLVYATSKPPRNTIVDDGIHYSV